MTKLKPCPFCGSKAKMERTPINPYYYVICTNLECDATVWEISANRRRSCSSMEQTGRRRKMNQLFISVTVLWMIACIVMSTISK